jgi:hypothetical protein
MPEDGTVEDCRSEILKSYKMIWYVDRTWEVQNTKSLKPIF